MKRSLALALAMAALMATSAAFALMPPHVTSINPPDGGVLKGRMIVIEGYSLGHADLSKQLKIVDATKAKRTVAYKPALSCKSVGKCGPGSPPGACQSKCSVNVTLENVEAGQTIRLTFLRMKATITVGPAEKDKKPKDKK